MIPYFNMFCKGFPWIVYVNVLTRGFGGLDFVNNPKRKIVDNNGLKYGLHTKFEVVRNKTGKIKGYELVDIKFCPESGEENPFVRTGYYKK